MTTFTYESTKKGVIHSRYRKKQMRSNTISILLLPGGALLPSFRQLTTFIFHDAYQEYTSCTTRTVPVVQLKLLQLYNSYILGKELKKEE